MRNQFPILQRTVHGGKPLVYLDSAATTQKPQAVLDAISGYYRRHNSNVHRGAHALAAEATVLYEQARTEVARFINATNASEVVFTRGTTESINLVASSWGGANLRPGDVVLVTEMEHHSNIVPWQLIAMRTGAVVKAIPVHDNGTLDVDAAIALMTPNTRLLAFTHVSNTLGTINNVQSLCREANSRGITTLVDGAQAVLHLPVDVQKIGCDFYVFSGHKLYAPTGIGVLYGRQQLLNDMPPYQGGGSMIDTVSIEATTFLDTPQRFEAGTPNIEGAVGLSAAIRWFAGINLVAEAEREHELVQQTLAGLSEIQGLRIIGTAEHHVGIVSFTIEGMHAHDLGVLLDEQGVAIRTGHHCTMPLMKRMGCTSTARVSLAVYNNSSDVEQFLNATHKAVRLLVS